MDKPGTPYMTAVRIAARDGEITINTLARWGVLPIYRAAERACRRGLLKRAGGPRDARRYVVTDAGREAVEADRDD